MGFWHPLLFAAALASSTDVPNPELVQAVPEPLRAELHGAVARHGSPEQRLQQLVDFVFGESGLHLAYDTSVTRTVAETYTERRANCVSATLLFVALARELGLKAMPHEFEQILGWEMQQGVLYSIGHVNSQVRIGQFVHVVDIDGSPKIAREAPRPASDARMLAHFYNNRGAELMQAGDAAGALAHYEAALASDRGFVPAWNNLGVFALRQGDLAGAESAFLRALAIAPRSATTLMNLVVLHGRSGDLARQAEFERQLAQVRRKDPFHHFVVGLEAERRDALDLAEAHYRRAIRLREGEHLFHFGLARVAYRQGRLEDAARALARAQSLSEGEVSSRYHAKLQSLSR